jgi:hypothetical protein
MYNMSIWLHNVTREQPPVNIKTTAQPLTDAHGNTHTQCRLVIAGAPSHSDITLLMTNDQAQQIIDTLTNHIREQNQQTIDQLMDEIDANPL